MSTQELKLNAVVRHQERGVGRVVELEEDGQWVVIDFQRSPGHRMAKQLALTSLTILPDDGLEVTFQDSPDTVYSWVSEAPLKLVAAALTDLDRRTGKAGDLRDRLDLRVLRNCGASFDNWWKRVQPAVKESRYFYPNGRNGWTFLRGFTAADIPASPLSSPARGSRATKKETEPFAVFLSRVSRGERGLHEFPSQRQRSQALKHLMASDDWDWFVGEQSAEHLLANISVCRMVFKALGAPEHFGRLLDGLHRISQCLTQANGEQNRTDPWIIARAEMIGEIVNSTVGRVEFSCHQEAAKGLSESLVYLHLALTGIRAKLARHSERAGDAAELLQQGLGRVLSASSPSLHSAWAAGFWAALVRRPSSTRPFLDSLARRLEIRARLLLWEEMVHMGLSDGTSDEQINELNRLLDILNEPERTRAVQWSMVRAAEGGVARQGALRFVAASRLAGQAPDWTDRLSMLVMAALLLAESEDPIMAQASNQLGDAFDRLTDESDQSVTYALLSGIRARFDQRLQHLTEELEERRDAYDVELERKRREEERLRQQNETFRAQMASGRQESRLEVRLDMLLEIGDILQRALREDSPPEERLRDVIARIPVALGAGGAETLGTAGETVPYDPRLHHSTAGIPNGTLVRLVAPGVVARGESFGDRVILKANVIRQSEVS